MRLPYADSSHFAAVCRQQSTSGTRQGQRRSHMSQKRENATALFQSVFSVANAHSIDDNAIICNLRDFELEHCKYDPTHDTWVNKSSANNLHCVFFANHNPCASSALGLQTPLAEHCTPDRWTCHSVRASPPWTTCSPRHSGSSAGTNVFDKVAGVLSTVQLFWRLHVAFRKPQRTGS